MRWTLARTAKAIAAARPRAIAPAFALVIRFEESEVAAVILDAATKASH
jgi:hypothetical protein